MYDKIHYNKIIIIIKKETVAVTSLITADFSRYFDVVYIFNIQEE